MHESRRSETKQEAGRAALLPPALTSPHGARRLYLGTATVCGAAAPLGHGAECRFSRQQTTTAPSKPLEAAAPRPAHRCFDSHSPATTALDSPVAATPPRAGHPARISAGKGGKEEGRAAPLPTGGLPPSGLPLPPPKDDGASLPQGLPEGWGGRPSMRKQKQHRGGSPHGHPAPAPGASPKPKPPRSVSPSQDRTGAAPRAVRGSHTWPGRGEQAGPGFVRGPPLPPTGRARRHAAPEATQRPNLGRAPAKGSGEP